MSNSDHLTRAVPSELDISALPPKIAAIIERLHTQDNRATSHPLFAVQQKRRIYGIDPDRCDDIVWLDESNDYREATADEFAAMEVANDNGDNESDGWYRTGYIDKWEFVTGGFTEQGCKDVIACNGHNLNEPRIYAYSGYRNAEFIAVREWLMSLSIAAASQPPAELATLRATNAELLAALKGIVARIEANGGIGEYTAGPAFVMQAAYDAIAGATK